MIVQVLAGKLARFMSVPADNPDLLKAQYRAFSYQIPMMYFILMSSTWGVASTHMAQAPFMLTVIIPLALTVICTVRLFQWWGTRHIKPSPEVARRALSRTNRIAGIIAIFFTVWSLAIYPYGDAYGQAHLAFYMAVTGLSCIFCLMHLRSAAVTVAIVVNGAFIAFFASTGQPTFVATAINVALVSIAMLVVVLANYRDFTDMIEAQTEALRKHHEQSRLLHMIDDMPVAVMTVDPTDFTINYLNETSRRTLARIEHLLPIKVDDLLGASIDVFHQNPDHQRRLLSDPANLPHRARIRLGPETLDLQASAVRADDGSYIGPMLTWAIVTKEIEAENRIRHLAHFDLLTGLANRNAFQELLDAAFAVQGSRAALLYIDLDGFKLINDTKGHRAGDALLQQVADRLRAIGGRPGITIARLGGDEFAVLTQRDEQAAELAAALVATLGAPYQADDGRDVQIGASIGIALAPKDGEDAETLMARADMALYAAKAAGKGTFRMFEPDMESRVQERMRLETKLRDALKTQEGLFVFYQPIVDIETGAVTTREALLRWHHPQRGWISPAEFIPVAEQSGLIDQLGTFVLSRACRDAAAWEDNARVAVNISASQLGRGTLTPAVLTALVETGLPPSRLEVEVTETALLNDENGGIRDLRQLRGIGVRVALDDFGTGYSSLAHLRIFPFDKIKIDGSFVRDAVERPDCAAVVKAISDLGKRLGVTTVAEGVETQAHLDRIRAEGCREVQGYFYGYPAPNEADAPLVAALEEQLRIQSQPAQSRLPG